MPEVYFKAFLSCSLSSDDKVIIEFFREETLGDVVKLFKYLGNSILP